MRELGILHAEVSFPSSLQVTFSFLSVRYLTTLSLATNTASLTDE
jgi:hypothetical protein